MKIESSKPKKQRKFHYDKPLHMKQQGLASHLDKKLAKQLEKRSIPIRKGDTMKVMRGGIANMVNVVVKKGKPEIRSKVERAVIVRVKKEYRRPNGMRVRFEDNAVVLVDEKGVPKASEIKGVIAKEVGERFPKIAGISSAVI